MEIPSIKQLDLYRLVGRSRSIDNGLLDPTQDLPGMSRSSPPFRFLYLLTADVQFLPYFLGLALVSAYSGKVALAALREQRLKAGGKP